MEYKINYRHLLKKSKKVAAFFMWKGWFKGGISVM